MFLCFIYVFSIDWCLKRSFGLVGRREELHESSRSCMSHQPCFLSRLVKAARVVTFQNFKSCNFLDLSSFLVLGIISSTDVQIGWFKLLWKDNSEYYKFHEETFLRKCLLNGQKYPWTCCICLNGDSWRWNSAFPSSWV